MIRNLIGWVLLAPMLLNGLWVVCNDGSSKAAAAPVPVELSQLDADCAKMCPMKHQAAGEMCLLLPGESKKSISILDFGVAILTPEFQLTPLSRAGALAPELPAAYSSPVLYSHTPPPKA
jgi:hypothetical protein